MRGLALLLWSRAQKSLRWAREQAVLRRSGTYSYRPGPWTVCVE